MSQKLRLLNAEKYNQQAISLSEKLITESNKTCFVTLNKTYMGIQEVLKKNNIDLKKVYFIDAVTPKLFMIENKSNCIFIDLTKELSVLANELLNVIKINKIDTVIFDSLSSLIAYKKEKEIIDFIHYLVPFFKKLKVNVVFFALNEDKKHKSIKQIKMIVDESTCIE